MLQSHHLPSPARLGLTNPNSPSLLPNPPTTSAATTTSSSSSQQQQQHHRLTTTSSALLPLLPPLSRAQSLLLQMSSLATKLFDLSPNRAAWLSSFRGSLPTFLSSPPLGLPAAAAPALPPVSSTKEALSLFTSLQTQLFEAVAELQEILDLQDSKVKLSREILSKDATLLAFAKKIKEAEHVLDLLVDDYSDYRRADRSQRPKVDISDLEEEKDPTFDSSSSSSALSLNDILSYAHRISYTTFAPPEFGAGQAPLRGALPPAPQDEQMRASQLYQFADLDVGVPKAADAKDKASDRVLLENLIEPTPPRDEPQVVLPPNLPAISVPPGWRKGMPVDLPMELPPVPPGWKPGDPVPLPPLDGLMGANKGEEQRMAGAPVLPIPPPAQPRQPEPIQVKYVQLDINPEDEFSSDYSSEVGSSDEDDED